MRLPAPGRVFAFPPDGLPGCAGQTAGKRQYPLARKKAIANESRIIAEAKEEAARIIAQAEKEAELEKKRVAAEVKQEMINVASLMAAKVISAQVNTSIQDELVEETLKEMGDTTWRS